MAYSYGHYMNGRSAEMFNWEITIMGLFDFFSKDAGLERRRASAQKRLANMYYQSAERNAALHDMAQLAQQNQDEKALHVLLSRFEHVNPSTTVDQEEKEYAVELLKGIGQFAVGGTQRYIEETSEAIFWPMRFLESQMSDEEFASFLAKLLAETDLDYVRDPKKKLGLVQLAREHRTDAMEEQLLRFINDFDENVRVHAINILLEWGTDGMQEALVKQWADPAEDSRRVWARIADAFIENNWKVDRDLEAIREHIPSGIRIGSDGTVTR